MSLVFESVRVHRIGGESADSGHQWATITVRLKDDGIDHTYSLDANILVPKRPDVTFHELQEVARESAIAIFRKAADVLAGASVAALEEQELAVRAAEAARIAATFGDLSKT